MRNNKKKNKSPAALEPPTKPTTPSPSSVYSHAAPFKLQPIFLSLCINRDLGVLRWASDGPLRSRASQIFEDSCSVSSDVSWGLTGRQTQPRLGCRCSCLLSLFSWCTPLSLFLSLFLSLSLMPLSVWRLIKRLPSQPPPHQPSSGSPRHRFPAKLERVHVCPCT